MTFQKVALGVEGFPVRFRKLGLELWSFGFGTDKSRAEGNAGV
jgi:hypothetical protein